MIGVLRRGSLNFAPHLNNKKSHRGSQDSNLYGGYRDSKPGTPEISVIALDFRRYSEDLKKFGDNLVIEESTVSVPVSSETTRDLSQDVDSDVISNFLGHYTRWQFLWTFILTIFQVPMTLQMFAFVFQTAAKDFWCNTTDSSNVTKNSCTIPNPYYEIDSSNNTKCTDFRFSDDGSGSMTLVEEYGLICERKYFLTVVEMCFLAGAAVGSVSSGWISDRYGRKHTLMIFAMVQVVFGSILAFSSSLAMYMTLRVIIGFASMTVAVVSFVLVVELVSGKWRTIIGILNILPMAVSYVLTAGIAYYIRDWRTLQLVISLPWLALLFIWYCVPESPRWLLSCGRLEALYKILERAARFNRLQLPANYKKTLEAVAPYEQKDSKALDDIATGEQNDTISNTLSTPEKRKPSCVEKTNPVIVAFNKTYLRTTCLNLVVWLTLVVLYYGLTLHLSNLGGDIYLNTAVVGSIEVVSIIVSIFIVLKVGIRRSLIAFMLIAGVGCLLTNLVPEGENNLVGVIALAMISKCVIGANNAIIPTYTAGQYPTEIRNFGVGLGNLAAGIALVLVPYVWLLEHITALLPLTVMGICGIIGAVGLCMMKDIQE